MANNKVHIDKLFADGLRNFSLLVSNKDLEAIDDKTAQYRDTEISGETGLFGSFELEVGENDWLSTKAKLENEKAAMTQDNFMAEGFENFELEVSGQDWTRTYEKLRLAKRRRVAYWWWLSAGMVILALGLFYFSYQSDKVTETVVAEQVQPVTPPVNTPETSSEDPIIKEQNNTPENNGAENAEMQPDVNTHVNPVNETPETKQNSNTTTRVKHSANNANTGSPEAIAKTGQSPAKVIADVTGKTNSAVRNPEAVKNASELIRNNGVKNSLDESIAQGTKGQTAPEAIKHTGNTSPSLSDNANSTGNANNPQVVKSTETLAGNFEEAEKNKSGEVKNDAQPVVNAELPDSNENKKQDVKTPEPKLPKTRFYVAAVNQIGLTDRRLDKLNNAKYNAIRNAAEKPFMQWTYGLEFGLQKKKSQFSVGVQSTTQAWASNYNYKNTGYKDSISVYNQDSVLLKRIYYKPFDTSIQENHVIKITKIQVPFEFTQFFALSPKMNMMTTLGGTIGFTTSMKGTKHLHPFNGALYPYEQFKSHENKVSFTPSLSLGVQYKLNRNFSLQGAAYGNYTATNRYKSNYPVKENAYSIGVSIKLLYFIK